MRGPMALALAAMAGCLYPPSTTAAQREVEERLSSLEAGNELLVQLVEDLQVENASLQAEIDGLRQDADELGEDVDQLFAEAADDARVVAADIVLDVPASYVDVNAALGSLDDAMITSDATVTIQIAPGTYDYYDSIEVTHPNSDRIQIVGDATGLVELAFHGPYGLVVSNGAHLDLLRDVVLTSDGSLRGNGIVATRCSSIALAGSISVSGFEEDGVRATHGGVVTSTATSLVVSDNGTGVRATHHGVAVVPEAAVSNSVVHGVEADRGGLVDSESSSSIGNGGGGYHAGGSSALFAFQSTASGNAGDGYAADSSFVFNRLSVASSNGGSGSSTLRGGFMDALQATAQDNGEMGFRADIGGTVYAPLSTSTGNVLDDYIPAGAVDPSYIEQ